MWTRRRWTTTPSSVRSNIIDGRSVSRQGLILGLITATTTWLWVAAVDGINGRPFHTFGVLGGVAGFTIVHYILNIAYASAVVAIARGTTRTPSLIIGAIFGFIVLEIAFGMVSTILSQTGLGGQSWVAIFGGSLIGAAIMFALLIRSYDLRARLHEAEDER
jgi:hypothetical protein